MPHPIADAEAVERTHIHLFSSDIQWLKATFGASTGYSKAIRTIVRAYRKGIEAQAGEAARSLELGVEVDLE